MKYQDSNPLGSRKSGNPLPHLHQNAARRFTKAKSDVRRAARLWLKETPFMPSARYLLTTESHVYAFAIAANALLSFFPFVLILLDLCRNWLHWQGAYHAILGLVSANLPSGADFVIKGLTGLAGSERRVEVVTIILMFYASSGVFLPLEVALNRIWEIKKDRNIALNLLTSFLLAIVSGVLALLSVALVSALVGAATFLLGWLPWHEVVTVFIRIIMEVVCIPLMIAIYYIIYYYLPNGKVPSRRVLPASIMAGIVTEVVKLIYFLTLPLFHFRENYGPFAVPVTLLFWAYVGSVVMLWGAHLSAQVRPLPAG
ncbi:MAG: YihY/virulence factor BrkB family protein [Terriglobia bacterium]